MESMQKRAASQALQSIVQKTKQARVADRLGDKAPRGFMIQIGLVPETEEEEQEAEGGEGMA